MNTKEERKEEVLDVITDICDEFGFKVSVDMISNETGLSESTIRKYVRQLVKEGHPIASDKDGFWIMHSKKEMQEYLNKLQKVQVALSERIFDAYWAFQATYGGKG